MLRNTSASLADAQRVITGHVKAAAMGSASSISAADLRGHRQCDPLQRIFDYERLAFPHEKQLP